MPENTGDKLILASSSPRRRELLSAAGIAFKVHPAHVPEQRKTGEAPLAYARRLAQEKARAVATSFPGRSVLGADTIVVLGDEVLEKPADASDAERMLQLLRGKTHEVTTAVCLIGAGEGGYEEETRHETTLVYFGEVSDEEIRAYVQSGEPMDKAGAYAIQGIASRWIRRIEGDYCNVVGLPVALVYEILRQRANDLR